MFELSASAEEAKKAITELLEKCGVDEDKWREELNSKPIEQRQMVFTFDTGDVKNGFVVKLNFLFTAVKFTITDEKVLKEIEDGNMD